MALVQNLLQIRKAAKMAFEQPSQNPSVDATSLRGLSVFDTSYRVAKRRGGLQGAGGAELRLEPPGIGARAFELDLRELDQGTTSFRKQNRESLQSKAHDTAAQSKAPFRCSSEETCRSSS